MAVTDYTGRLVHLLRALPPLQRAPLPLSLHHPSYYFGRTLDHYPNYSHLFMVAFAGVAPQFAFRWSHQGRRGLAGYRTCCRDGSLHPVQNSRTCCSFFAEDSSLIGLHVLDSLVIHLKRSKKLDKNCEMVMLILTWWRMITNYLLGCVRIMCVNIRGVP